VASSATKDDQVIRPGLLTRKIGKTNSHDPECDLGTPFDALDMELLFAFEALETDDGSDLVIELIDLYLNELPRRVSEIREAAISFEPVLLKRAAHLLKGSSATLGVRHVAKACDQLEHMDGHDSPQTVAALVRLLEYESAMANASLALVRQQRLSKSKGR
jgi:HPt (histidine-containing phosphotransfer) domain-containing protein